MATFFGLSSTARARLSPDRYCGLIGFSRLYRIKGNADLPTVIKISEDIIRHNYVKFPGEQLVNKEVILIL
jgi:hypothetical protein